MMGQRNRCRSTGLRAGFTLFELLVSLAAASVLMVGLSSAIYIAVQGVDVAGSPQAKVLEAQAILADIHADLQYAITVTEKDKAQITFTIPDRDDPDTLPETVRYVWQGKDKPLTRQYNGGAVVVVAESIQFLEFKYATLDLAVEYITIELASIDNPDVLLVTSIPMLNRP